MFRKKKGLIKIKNKEENGYSIVDLSVVITIIGILALMLIPKFSPALEYLEVLIAEKYLFKKVNECQMGLINNEVSPQYNFQSNITGLGIFKNNKFTLSYTGDAGKCINAINSEGNKIRLTKTYLNQSSNYSLIINLITGEKISEGQIPEWLDWWEGFHSPLIPKNDPSLNDFY